MQGQINLAGAQQVWVAGGRYTPTGGGSFSLRNGVAVYGGFVGSELSLGERPVVNPVGGQPSSTTLTTAAGSVFYNSNLDNTARLDGVVITGGNASYGGGIYNDRSSPQLTGCVITANTASTGGGIYNYQSSSPQLTGCVLSANTAYFGGGICNARSNPQLTGCVLSANTATNYGGGIYNSSGSSPQLTGCVLSANTASYGGGIYNYNSSPSLTNCSLTNNSATNSGGGIYNNSSSPSLTGCLLAANSANLGGGIYNYNSSPSLINCTLTANRATAGAALINFASSQPVLTNTILWDNQESTNTSINNDAGTGVTANYCLIGQGETDFTGSNNLTATSSPFVSSTNYQLNACSSAINAGDPASTPATSGATDLAGNPRFFQNGRIDIGAYEFQGNPAQPVAITQQPVSGSSVCVGSSVSVPVSVSGSVSSYQWFKDNLSSPVTGQTSATLNLTNVQFSDAGAYSLVVTGSCHSVTSTPFSLTVNTPPAAPTLTSLSRTVPQSDTPLPLGPFVNADSGNPLSFSGTNGIIANPPTANVSQVGVQRFSVSQTTASGCVSGVTVFTITVQAVTPASQTVCRSSRVVLTTTTPGVRYEWYKNGQSAPFKLTEIASIQRGTATSSLTLVSIQTTASYYVKVFQANGESTLGSFSFEGPFVVTVNYGCLAPGARQAALEGLAPAEGVEAGLQIVLLPNPLTEGRLRAVIHGAEGEPLSVELLDLRGLPLHHQQWDGAAPAQAVDWDVSAQPAGVYLLRAVSRGASGISRSQSLKVLKVD